MYHYIYKVSDNKGRFYVGRHSTINLEDNYLGSGKWIRGIKDKSCLKKDIIEFVENFEDLLEKERTLISEFINDPLNMNFSDNSCGFGCGDRNPARSEKEKKRRSEYNWMKSEEGRRWVSKNNPSKKESVKKKRREKAKEQWNKKTHNFQNDDVITRKKASTTERNKKNNPMFDKNVCEKVSSKLKENYKNGTHNFCDPKNREKVSRVNRERLLTNENPMKNKSISILFQKSKDKVICPHCKKTGGKPVMMRYHFDKCKSKL